MPKSQREEASKEFLLIQRPPKDLFERVHNI